MECRHCSRLEACPSLYLFCLALTRTLLLLYTLYISTFDSTLLIAPAATNKSTMPSERVIRFTHTFLFTLVLLASIVALGISGSLVGHYNSNGYPPAHTNAYRDRIRILLVASVWTTAWGCKLFDNMCFIVISWQFFLKKQWFWRLASNFLAKAEPLAFSPILFPLPFHSFSTLLASPPLQLWPTRLTVAIRARRFRDARLSRVSSSSVGLIRECILAKKIGVFAVAHNNFRILVLFALVFLIVLCFMARGRYGAHRSTLYLEWFVKLLVA